MSSPNPLKWHDNRYGLIERGLADHPNRSQGRSPHVAGLLLLVHRSLCEHSPPIFTDLLQFAKFRYSLWHWLEEGFGVRARKRRNPYRRTRLQMQKRLYEPHDGVKAENRYHDFFICSHCGRYFCATCNRHLSGTELEQHHQMRRKQLRFYA